MNKKQFYYLMYMFYREVPNEALDNMYWDKYISLAEVWPDELMTAKYLINEGYLSNSRLDYKVTPKGLNYVMTHLPFNELWQLYLSGMTI